MRRGSVWIGLLLSVLLTLAPAAAVARVGNGGSFGSRGSRTLLAPPPTPTAPGGAAGFGQGTPYGGGVYSHPGLGAGLLGGLLGVGIGHALFGRHYGYGYGGGIGLFGFLIRLIILFFVVRWLLRLVFRRRGPGLFAAPMPAGPVAYGVPQSAPLLGAPVAVAPSDYRAFEVLLQNIQAAWSNGNLAVMPQFATPEMVQYFAQQLSGNASRGVRNIVSDVHLQKGDLAEAWAEQGREYATVAMRYSMVDATYDRAGHVVDGSPTEHISATEYWTFTRSPGGQWLLSAIQQTR